MLDGSRAENEMRRVHATEKTDAMVASVVTTGIYSSSALVGYLVPGRSAHQLQQSKARRSITHHRSAGLIISTRMGSSLVHRALWDDM